MMDDKQIIDKIMESIEAMTVEEYNELYSSISDEENVTVFTNSYDVTVTIAGTKSYVDKIHSYNEAYPPILLQGQEVAIAANSNYAKVA